MILVGEDRPLFSYSDDGKGDRSLASASSTIMMLITQVTEVRQA